MGLHKHFITLLKSRALLTFSSYVYKFSLFCYHCLLDIVFKSLGLWFLIYPTKVCQLNRLFGFRYPFSACRILLHLFNLGGVSDSHTFDLVSFHPLDYHSLRLPTGCNNSHFSHAQNTFTFSPGCPKLIQSWHSLRVHNLGFCTRSKSRRGSRKLQYLLIQRSVR